MKRALAILLMACMLLCGVAYAELEPDTVIEADPSLYANIDLSKHETLTMYLVGDKPNDWDRIMGMVNETLEGQYNTKLDTVFLPWSDYETMYSLVLASGENVDMIYTATWCYFYTEAQKGSYYPLTEEFIQKYMPLCAKYKVPVSWDQMNCYGGIQGASRDFVEVNFQCIAVREDLREKYDIAPLAGWDDLKNYLITIAEKETPASGIYAYNIGKENTELWYLHALTNNTAEAYYKYYRWQMDPDNVKAPQPEDIQFYTTTDEFRTFVNDAKQLADAGVWSRNAINNTTALSEAFANGTSASLSWNNTVFTFMKQTEANNPGAKTAAYSLLQDNQKLLANGYHGDALALTASCRNPERAAMVIDLLKFDTKLNNLICLGIEGEHYIDNGDGTYVDGPKNADFIDGGNSLSWAIPNGAMTQAYTDERQVQLQNWWKARRLSNPTAGFVFDSSSVKSELAAVEATVLENWASLTLGLVDNPDATLDEMNGKLEKVGLNKVMDAFRTQYAAWKAQ